MRCGCALVILAILMILTGIQQVREAHAFTRPKEITCEQFLQAPPQEGWYRITGGVVKLDEAVYSIWTRKSAEVKTPQGDLKIDAVYIPVHTPDSWDEKKEDFPPTSLVVETHDPEIIETLKQWNRMDNSKPEESKRWMEENMAKLLMQRDITGVVQTGMNSSNKTREDISKLQKSLEPGYVIIDEGRVPSMSGGMGMLFGGFFMAVCSVLYWGWFGIRWKRRLI